VRGAIVSTLEAEGVSIIDPTRALVERASAGELIYSSDHDGHLNELGHRVVAHEVVAALSGGN
jgi:hypothetical protein